jgi:MoaA/NifB/PqqE/SkfB family radical SAM enzyme
MKDSIEALKNLGLKTVELTGGGEPTMYKDINDLIAIITDALFNLKCGLITNGTNLKVLTRKSLERLTWIRISMNCLEQVDSIDIPKLPDTCTLGFSYVWNEGGKVYNRNMLNKIQEYAKKYDAKYIRIVPNCLSVEHILKAREEVPRLIKGIPNAFFQSKEYEAHTNCYMGYLKPFLYTDGYLYHCSANPLLERRFHPDFRMGHWTEIGEIWKNPKPFSTEKCGLCFFAEQNRLIEDLMTKREHEEFL